MRSEPIEPHRLGATAVAVRDFLRDLGVKDVVFTKTKHVRAEFYVGPRFVQVHFACTPRDDGMSVKRTLTKLRKAISEACSR